MKTTDPNMADRSRVSNSFRYWMNTPASFWYLCAPKSFLNRDFQCVKDPKYWKPPSRICNPATYSSVSGYAPSCTNKVDPNKVECCYNEYEAQYFKLEFQSNVTNVDRLINGKKAP
jgi:hypothetical protein